MQRALLALAALLVSGITRADPTWYLGAGGTRANGDFQPEPIGPCDGPCSKWRIDAASGKGFFGWRPLLPFSLEMDYVDFGSTATRLSHGDIDATGNAIPIYAMGYLSLPALPVELYGKAGVAYWDLSRAGYTGHDAAHGLQFAWGVGAQGHLGPAGVRFEYERFSIAQSSTGVVYVYSLSAYVRLPL